MSRQHGPAPQSWSYDAVLACLTNERLSSYLRATNGDVSKGFHLYEWNMRASAGIITLTSMTEVVVRNAIDRELTAWASTRRSGQSWFDLDFLDHRGQQDLDKARRRASSRVGGAEIHGKVVAELSLGFWRYLVESRYLTALWIPATHHAFPHGPDDLRDRQRIVSQHMKRLTFVRNRAAHHEPIHQRNLERDLETALTLTRWVSHDAAGWVHATSELLSILAEKPQSVH